MSKKEERKERMSRLSSAIGDQQAPEPKNIDSGFSGITLPKKPPRSYEDIARTRKIEIPICYIRPYNGRILVISVPADETVTEGGLILPFKMKDGKDGSIKDVRRYFVAAFDVDGIPEYIAKDLFVGKEVNPFLPQEAEEWNLPKVIDWHTGTSFESIHYTELAGGSMVQPKEVTG